MQKISSIHTLIHKIQQIFGSHELMAMPTQQSVKELFAFLNLQQHIKNQFIPSIHSWDTFNLIRVVTHFVMVPTQKYFDQLLIYVNL